MLKIFFEIILENGVYLRNNVHLFLCNDFNKMWRVEYIW
jgi:hypothetical protein